MERVKTIDHKGKQIIFIDLSHCGPADTTTVLPLAFQTISKCAPKSALLLTNVAGAVYNKDVAAAMKDFAAKNSPYIKGSAVVGVEGIQMVLLQTVIFATRREIKVFSSLDAAKDWLVSL